MLLWFEIKKYLYAYKAVAAWLIVSAATCALLAAGVRAVLARDGVYEPFVIGIVDGGTSPELRYVFDYFNRIVSLQYMSKEEAERRLASGGIPAYAELPDNFAGDIVTGANTPFVLRGNADYPLRVSVAELLAAGGVAFLSSAQAGIYATLDYAAEHGMPRETVSDRLVIPINVAYVRKLLAHESFFSAKTLTVAGEADPAAHYLRTFAAFLLMAGLITLTKPLGGYTRAVHARHRLAGRPLVLVQALRLAALCVVLAVPAAAFFALWGGAAGIAEGALTGVALALCVGAYGLMAAAFLRRAAAYGVFVFLSALGMLFVSGGIVPPAFLPQGLYALRYAAPVYWAAQGLAGGAGALTAWATIYFGAAVAGEFLYTRFSSAA